VLFLEQWEIDLNDLNAFLAVANAKGFRDGARASGGSASGLSEAVRRLETLLGVRLFHRTTRSVVPTEAGQRLLERLRPALNEVAGRSRGSRWLSQPAGGHVKDQCPSQCCTLGAASDRTALPRRLSRGSDWK